MRALELIGAMDLRWCMIVPLAVCMCALPVAISESGLSGELSSLKVVTQVAR